MKVFFISEFSSSLPLAIEVQKQDHDVKFFVHDKDYKECGEGFVDMEDSWEHGANWADLVICDFTRWGAQNEKLRSQGKLVVGGTKVTDLFEEDRQEGQKLFKSVGMQTIESQDFSDLEKAISYIQSNPDVYVVKVSGKAQEDSSLTHVGEDESGLDAIVMLEHFRDKLESKIDAVSIQRRVQGVEVAIGGFFNGKEFLDPVFLNFEHKKLMPGPTSAGVGPNTGEMGTCAIWIPKTEEIYSQTIGRMVGVLRKLDYHGYFDINLIITEEDEGPIIYPLEMTNRFGWPTLPLQLETLKDNDLAEFFYAMAAGKKMDPRIYNLWSTCVVVGSPPFPYDDSKLFKKMSENMPVIFKDNDLEGIYPADIKYTDEHWTMAGTAGHVAICCGSGDTLQDSIEQAYERTDNVIVPNKIYRIDVGSKIDEYMNQLVEWDILSKRDEYELAGSQ